MTKILFDRNNIETRCVEVNPKTIQLLTHQNAQRSLEFFLYFHIAYEGKEEMFMGKPFYSVDFDVDALCKVTGYKKTRVYDAIKNLITMGILVKVTTESRSGAKSLLMVVEPTESHLNRFISGTIPAERNHSGTAESFRAQNEARNSISTNNLHDQVEAIPPETMHFSKRVDGTNNRTDGICTDGTNVNDNLCDDTLRNDTNVNDTLRNDTLRNDTYIYDTLRIDPNDSVKITKIKEEGRKVAEMFSNNIEVRDKHLESILKRLDGARRDEERKKVQGYHSKDYKPLKGLKTSEKDKSGCKSFIKYYMFSVWDRRKVDFYIPKTRFGKYYKLAKSRIEQLGSLEEAQNFIDWYLREESFKSSGYSLDLMLSAPIFNQYKNASAKRTRKGISKGFVHGKEERENSTKGAVWLREKYQKGSKTQD